MKWPLAFLPSLEPMQISVQHHQVKTSTWDVKICIWGMALHSSSYIQNITSRESKCGSFFVQTRSHKKSVHPVFFVKLDKFSGIPPNIEFDWVLSI